MTSGISSMEKKLALKMLISVKKHMAFKKLTFSDMII